MARSLLHSRVHEAWSLVQGNWLGKGNDPSYSSSRTFETFPLPWPPGLEPAAEDDLRVAAVGAATRKLDSLRRGWLDPEGLPEIELRKRTLTELYNDQPSWLTLARAALDRAVFACYGWDEDPDALPEQQMLERLLDLNKDRAALAGKGQPR